MTQTAKLTASDGQPGDRFGDSVAISGNIIVVVAFAANSGQGRAYIFVEPPNGWTNMTETAQLTASDGQPNDQFGTSVAISGRTVAVGAPYHSVESNPAQGASYVFVQPAGGWTNMTQTAKLTAARKSMAILASPSPLAATQSSWGHPTAATVEHLQERRMCT